MYHVFVIHLNFNVAVLLAAAHSFDLSELILLKKVADHCLVFPLTIFSAESKVLNTPLYVLDWK
jgi:hypothetical protein